MIEPARPLSDPQSCVNEIISVNIRIAEFGHLWANDAGELEYLLKKLSRLEKSKLRYLRTTKKEMWRKARAGEEDFSTNDRAAEAQFLVEEEEPELYPRIEELVQNVEQYRTEFKALEARGKFAQSILASIRNEEGIKDFVYWETVPDGD